MDTPDIELIRRVHTLFRGKGLSLCIAESCTGGLVGHLITLLPGASGFFDSSVVCYSPDSKVELVGVSRSVIRRHGTVSEDTAREMAISLRRKRGTDFTLSITGVLGPDAVEDKRPGLVYTAVDCKRMTTSRGHVYDGTREEIKSMAAGDALRFLCEVFEVWA